MKPKYLETYHIKEFIDYCNHKCVQIVYEQNSVENIHLKHYREKYKGYLYCKKVAAHLLKMNKSITNYELYNHLKHYRSWRTKTYGEDIALYDVMNYLVDKIN